MQIHTRAGFGLLLLTGPAFAFGGTEAAEAPAPIAAAPVASVPVSSTDMRVFWNGDLRFETADKMYSYRLGGRIHLDATWVTADDDVKFGFPQPNPDAATPGVDTRDKVDFRRARLYLQGDLGETFAFKAQYDFGGAAVGFRDVYLQMKDVLGATLTIGQFKEPFSLEELTSSNDISFIERSAPVSAFSPSRSVGIGLNGNVAGDMPLAWAVGVFHSNTNSNSGNAVGDGQYALTGRVAWAPIFQDGGKKLVHVGAAASMRSVDGYSSAARPEARTVGNWISTGSIGDADSVMLLGGELAGVWGPASLQAEYIQAAIDSDGADDPTLRGWYVYGSYFLTGESRSYRNGAFRRPRPNSPFQGFGNGTGAVELVARYSMLDYSDVADDLEMSVLSFGANWYLTQNVVLKANYMLATLDAYGDLNGDQGEALALRFQVTF